MPKTIYYIKRAIFTVFIATFLLAFGAALTSSYTLRQYEIMSSANPSSNAHENISSGDNVISSSYLVKEHEGVIGVFDQSGALMYKAEVYVKTLPERDRQMLKEGIRTDSYEEVLEILGDYTA